ncbi:hypothetical protein POKO110462_10695 [Pontibacter korlensis]|uniref:DUF937 domain-containing protein n=1 Tax=Pontibacter korlensis TaxID=400092 RepID=A0A0E3UW44_9BACT|nr:hypothetical protein [Pontibacter korlensis]AKD02391.1 hypothetical protein PKOR_03700 [Pontibacter korlensis]
MIENLINGLKGQLTGELQSKFNLQPDTANKSVDLAKDNVVGELKQRASSGEMGGLMDVLKGRKAPDDSSATNSIINKYVSDLTTRLGIPESVAKQVAPFAIKFIMQKIGGQASAGNISEGDLLGGLIGGGLKDKLGKGLGGLFK